MDKLDKYLSEIRLQRCPICLESNEQPKLLPCNHSLCIRCFTQIVQRKPDSNGSYSNFITCPQCSVECAIPEQGLATKFGITHSTKESQGNGNKQLSSEAAKSLIENSQNDITKFLEKLSSQEKEIVESCDNLRQLLTSMTVGYIQLNENLKSGEKGFSTREGEKMDKATKVISTMSAKVEKAQQALITELQYELATLLENKDNDLFPVEVCLGQMDNKIDPDNVKCCWKCGVSDTKDHSCQLEVQIITSDLETAMESEFKQIALEAIKINNGKTEIARQIKEHFDFNYGPFWHCIVMRVASEKNRIGFYIHNQPKSMVYMRVGQLYICLFKAQQDPQCWKCGSSKCKNTECKLSQPTVIQANMSQALQDKAKKYVMEALKMNTDASSAAKQIKNEFQKKYKGSWQCIVKGGERDRWGFCVTKHGGDSLIRLKVSEARILLFKTSD